MGEDWQITPDGPERSAKARVAGLAARQKGRVTRAHLLALDIPSSTIADWITTGFLYSVLPGVYAVGHPGTSEEADLFAAALYAGPHAGLDGMTAGLWRGLVKWRTATAIEVATPRRCRSLPAGAIKNTLARPVVVHDRRTFRRDTWRGIQGSAVLNDALGRPQPLFAHARGPFEVSLVQVCEVTGTRVPDALNVKIAGYTVDAVWWDEMVIVECDGEGNHGTFRQRRRDLGEDMDLRALGFLPIRYTTDKLEDPWAVHADLGSALDERRGRGRGGRGGLRATG